MSYVMEKIKLSTYAKKTGKNSETIMGGTFYES